MFATGDKVILDGRMATVVAVSRKAMFYRVRVGRKSIHYVDYTRLSPPRSLWQRIRALL